MAETTGPTTPVALVEEVYGRYPERVAVGRRRLGRPLTYAEKVLFAHAEDPHTIGLDRGVDYADYRPDRVAMQDATAQMALLQFMTAGLPRVAVEARRAVAQESALARTAPVSRSSTSHWISSESCTNHSTRSLPWMIGRMYSSVVGQ